MDGANSPGQARAYWITPYAFEPSGGGLGVRRYPEHPPTVWA